MEPQWLEFTKTMFMVPIGIGLGLLIAGLTDVRSDKKMKNKAVIFGSVITLISIVGLFLLLLFLA